MSGYQPEIYIELGNDLVSNRTGREFIMTDFLAIGDRGFLHVEELTEGDENPRFVYELGVFTKADFDGVKMTNAKLAILEKNYLKGLREAGLQDIRLHAVGGQDFDAAVAGLLKQQAPGAHDTAERAVPGNGTHGGVTTVGFNR